MTNTRLLLLCGLVAPLVAPAAAYFAARETPGYSHISNTYSDLSAQGQPAPGLMAAGLLLTGILVLLCAIGVGRVLPRGGRGVRAAMMIVGVAVAVTGLFRDYPRGKGGTYNPEAWLHNAAVAVAIAAIIAGMLLAARATYNQPGWEVLMPISLLCLAGVTISGGVLQFGSPDVDGLAERVLTSFTLVWVVATCTAGLVADSAPERISPTTEWSELPGAD